MADKARQWTDKKLSKMESHISNIYKTSAKGIYLKWNSFMNDADDKASDLQQEYEDAKKTGDKELITSAGIKLSQYKKEITLQNEMYQEMINATTERLAEVNKIALAYVNDQLPSVYMNNFNEVKVDADNLGVQFGIINEATLKRLILNGDIQLPYKELDETKDKRWNTKQLNSSVLQGILQGESMRNIAKRIYPITNRNKASAMRNARTMITGAENSGRLDSYKELKDNGLIVKKVWMATPDSRTRDLHIHMDGQEVDIEESFDDGVSKELMYPGDPSGAPESVYNCRCSMKTHIVGIRKADGRIEKIDFVQEGTTLHEQQMESEREQRGRKEIRNEVKKVLANPDNLSKEVLNIIGEKGDPIDIDRLLMTVNPNFHDPNYKYMMYHANCQRCAACYELGRRGYDVEAMAFDGNYPDQSTLFNFYKYRTEDTYLNKNNRKYVINRSPKTVANSVEDAMKEWGDGARASLSVTWRNSTSSHIVNLENVNGEIFIIDAQCGKKYTNIEKYLSQTKCAETEVLRLDTANFKSNDEFNIDDLRILCHKRGE